MGAPVKAAGATHTVGSKVWVACADDGWKKGEVAKVDGAKLLVRLEEGGEQLCDPQDCPLQNPALYGNGVEVGAAELRVGLASAFS